MVLVALLCSAPGEAQEPRSHHARAYKVALDAEAVDAEWSSAAEAEIRQALEGAGFVLLALECRQTMCWYQMTLEIPREDAYQSAQDSYYSAGTFGETYQAMGVDPSGAGTGFEVEVVLMRQGFPLPDLELLHQRLEADSP